MTEKKTDKLSLSSISTYEITVPGYIDKGCIAWGGDYELEPVLDAEERPATKIIVDLDQAGLHGFLDRIYSVGLPITAVINRQFHHNIKEDPSSKRD